MKKGCTKKSEQGGRINETSKTEDSSPIGGMLHLLSIGKGLYEACGLLMSGPFREWPMPELPQWAKNTCEQLRLTVLRGGLDFRPAA
jgi:hypothetical protein